jgi:multimeric flavodoxin WrbA
MEKVLVIFGSSRENGNTMGILQSVMSNRKPEIVDVRKLDITPYDYDHGNQGDAFLEIVEKMIAADTIVFATPVYWYSMSAYLKIFFDRLSDLIVIRKDLGRALKGKRVFVISTGTEEELPEGFEVPFARTSNYFDMEYCGCFYYYVRKEQTMSDETKRASKEFGKKVFSES